MRLIANGSEPPAVAGGFSSHYPPATAGGSDFIFNKSRELETRYSNALTRSLRVTFLPACIKAVEMGMFIRDDNSALLW